MKQQTNLRLDSTIKEQAKARAEAEGICLNELVERALEAYLSGAIRLDSSLVADDSNIDSSLISDLIARVERLEAAIAPRFPDPKPDEQARSPGPTGIGTADTSTALLSSPCPNCGSVNSIKHGKGKLPGSARLRCKDCGKVFTVNP